MSFLGYFKSKILYIPKTTFGSSLNILSTDGRRVQISHAERELATMSLARGHAPNKSDKKCEEECKHPSSSFLPICSAYCFRDYLSSTMLMHFFGQLLSQRPQLTQRSLLSVHVFSALSTTIASFGHFLAQSVQNTHVSKSA